MFSQPSCKDDGNHRLEEQGVRAGTDGQMDVGNLRRFGKPGIDDDQQFVRIFGDALELPRRLGNLMALHAVPADSQQEIRFRDIGLIDAGTGGLCAAADPEGAGKFLGQGAVLIL